MLNRKNAKVAGLGFVLALAAAAAVQGSVITCGDGANRADVYLEFSDGASYEFEVYFDGLLTGLELIDVVELDTTLETVRGDFGFGVFIDGFSFDGHSDIGWDGGENWWHYWTRESEIEPWTSSAIGAADRVIGNNGGDAWVYGHAAMPIPEPATLSLLIIGAAAVRRRRVA